MNVDIGIDLHFQLVKMNKYSLVLALITACFLSCTEVETPDTGLPQGFAIEQLFTPTNHQMGSWVALTVDDKERIIASDQYGDLYRFTAPASGDTLRIADVERIPLNIGFAQGMLWVDNSLLVMVNRYYEEGDELVSGIYKLTDSDGNDELDTIERVQSLEGSGEHGPHGIVLGPDGFVYFIAGNHTLIPDNFNYLFPDNWGEDNLIPVIKDPRGHANHIKPPGGWIARMDKAGTNFEVVAVGFRNAYDLAFDEDGDLYTFDSDMEWDMGTPWYRPIRVCRVIPGADFGWRTGSGKFPSYYPDSYPPIVEIGQGLPTGIMFGYELNFPATFRSNLFILDWSFGTIYNVNIEKGSAGINGSFSEFFSRNSFPVTDVISAGGDMYFTTGGRG